MFSLFFVGAALLLTFVGECLNSAPLGYEDEHGFHYGTPEERPAN